MRDVNGNTIPGLYGFDGRAGVEMERLAQAAEAKARAAADEREESFKTAKIEDVQNHELRQYVEQRGINADALLAELERTRALEAEYQAETAAEVWKPSTTETKPEEHCSPVSWAWRRKGLFGARQSNFAMMEPIWERPKSGAKRVAGKLLGFSDYEVLKGMPRDEKAHRAAGWQIIGALPQFGARVEALLALLDRAYRAGDVPKSVQDDREKLLDLRLELSDLVESSKALFRRASVAPSRFVAELDKVKAKREALEKAIMAQHERLAEIGIDVRTVS
jgi:hypothetical protein